MIIVVDTNVWISALQFSKGRGTPTLALEKAMSEDVIATCDEIDAEIFRVLTKKFSWEQHRATSALQMIQARSIRVKVRGTVQVCRDPNDNTVYSHREIRGCWKCHAHRLQRDRQYRDRHRLRYFVDDE